MPSLKTTLMIMLFFNMLYCFLANQKLNQIFLVAVKDFMYLKTNKIYKYVKYSYV